MLSLEQSKAILNKGERKYSDEEIKRLRDVLYTLAEFEIETLSKQKQPVLEKQYLKTKNK